MKITKYIFAGVLIGTISVVYNVFVFQVAGFYPDFAVLFDLGLPGLSDYYLLVFIKNFLLGIILTLLFAVGYRYLKRGHESGRDLSLGVSFITLYGVFAFISFSLGDMLFFQNMEGMAILVTLDGFIETLIASITIRFLIF